MASARPVVRHRWFRLASAILLVMLALGLMAPTASAGSSIRFSDLVKAGGALTTDCPEGEITDPCTTIIVEAFDFGGDKAGTAVCVFRATVTPPKSATIDTGCSEFDDGIFTTNRRLNFGELTPVSLTVPHLECNDTGCTETGTVDVDVSASWVGVGDIIRFRDVFEFEQGDCHFFFRGGGMAREATATMVVDGVTYDSDEAFLQKSLSKTRFTEGCV